MQLQDIKNLSKRERVLLASAGLFLVVAGLLLVQNYQLRIQNRVLQETVEKQNKKIANLEKLVKVFNKDLSDLKGAATDAKAVLGKTLEKMGQALKGEE
ncbi:MAG: hypothetical protein KIH67_004255 [Candidatus Moranbacteria bacterium]|nr:hypothetical protein [Candidatus Moranbacteria bacterium]